MIQGREEIITLVRPRDLSQATGLVQRYTVEPEVRTESVRCDNPPRALRSRAEEKIFRIQTGGQTNDRPLRARSRVFSRGRHNLPEVPLRRPARMQYSECCKPKRRCDSSHLCLSPVRCALQKPPQSFKPVPVFFHYWYRQGEGPDLRTPSCAQYSYRVKYGAQA